MKYMSDHFPEDFLRMRTLWGRVRLDFFENDEVGIERFENAFKSASWSWIPDLREVDSKDVDRRKDMLLGPLFSSINSSWPIDDKGPMIPLAQFDLGNASKILGEDLGCGLIQIFCPQGDSRGQNIFIREVEAEIVRSDLMIAPPLFSDDVNGFASVGWAQGSSSKDRRIYGGKCLGNPPVKALSGEVEISRREFLHDEVKVFGQPDHGGAQAR